MFAVSLRPLASYSATYPRIDIKPTFFLFEAKTSQNIECYLRGITERMPGQKGAGGVPVVGSGRRKECLEFLGPINGVNDNSKYTSYCANIII